MAFTWAAIYNDGEVYHQTHDGVERSSEQIDRKRLSSFVLYDHNGLPLFTQHLDSGHRLIYRRRTEQEPGGIPVVVHLVGWQETVYTADGRPRSVQHITYAFEKDSRLVMAGKWRDDHRWYYAVQPVPAEDVMVE